MTHKRSVGSQTPILSTFTKCFELLKCEYTPPTLTSVLAAFNSRSISSELLCAIMHHAFYSSRGPCVANFAGETLSFLLSSACLICGTSFSHASAITPPPGPHAPVPFAPMQPAW